MVPARSCKSTLPGIAQCKTSLYQWRIKSLANEGSALDIIVGAALCQPINRPHLPWQQPNGSAATWSFGVGKDSACLSCLLYCRKMQNVIVAIYCIFLSITNKHWTLQMLSSAPFPAAAQLQLIDWRSWTFYNAMTTWFNQRNDFTMAIPGPTIDREYLQVAHGLSSSCARTCCFHPLVAELKDWITPHVKPCWSGAEDCDTRCMKKCMYDGGCMRWVVWDEM